MSLIKKRRTEMDITQVELADKVKVSRGFMCQIESGKKSCPPWLVVRIARILNRDPRELFKTVVKKKTKYIARKR